MKTCSHYTTTGVNFIILQQKLIIKSVIKMKFKNNRDSYGTY